MPSISGSDPALMCALADVARAGATRAGHHSAKVFVSINGVQRAEGRADADSKVIVESMAIAMSEGGTPDTLTMDTMGFNVSTGHEVIATLGSINNSQRIFGGTVLKINKGFVLAPANPSRELHVVDYTWQLNGRKVIGRYSGSVSTIVTTIMTAYAPDVNLSKVASGLDSIDEITFAEPVDLTVALSRLAARIGARWRMDYHNRLEFCVSDVAGVTNPRELNTSNPTFQLADFGPIEYDRSQQITRVSMEGGGSNAATAVAVGETILPLEDAPETWYGDTGGVVVAGPQRLTYTGRQEGGGGTLVGTGYTPSSGPAVALASGSGVESGAHGYAVTFGTASGESLPGPTTSITVGALSAPSTAPTAGTPTIGSGVTSGAHQYAVTFVTSAGETTTSPLSGVVTTGPVTLSAVNPSTAPTLALKAGSSDTWADLGSDVSMQYAYSTAAGDTDNSQVTLPSPAGTVSYSAFESIDISLPYSTNPAVQWIFVYIKTNAGPNFAKSNTQFVFANNSAGGTLTATLVNSGSGGWASRTTNPATSNTATYQVNYNVVALTNIPVGPALVTSRKIYRTEAGGSQMKLLTTLANNTTTTYSDSTADASLGANIPTSNTAAANRTALSAIPIGPTGTTSRKIYRTAAAGSQLKLLATLADNSTTTYSDSTADASLGANAPSSDTSGLTQPAGQVLAGATSIPVAYWGASLPTAGWAIIGNGKQVIRYTGVSGGTSLTGIPASGAGSITASISYNTSITACPQLIGIPASGAGSIAYAIVQGDEINRFVTADDVLEQAALSALLDPLDILDGAAGIIEDILRDRRLSHGEALERAEAKLALVSGEATRFGYATYDKNTTPNRTVVANIASPTSFSGTFRIHSVTKTFMAGGTVFPRCSVQASDQLYTFEQLLNQGN